MTWWFALVRRFWPYLLAAAAIAVVIARVHAWHADAIELADRNGYERARAEMQQRVDAANAQTEKVESLWRSSAAEVDRAHQQQIADLDRKYREHPLPAVRLCKQAAAGPHQLPGAAAAAGGNPATASADGLSRDIAPDLERLVRAADEQAARLAACQRFVRSLYPATAF